jgi:photosystem II stability/assembly factor-like uncharacterized protein
VHALPPPLPTAVAFRNAQDGLLGTMRDIAVTRDGGRTWRVVFRTPRPVASIGYDPSGQPRAILDDGENIGGPHWRPERVLGRQFAPCTDETADVSDDWVLCIGQGGAGLGEKAVYRSTPDGWKRLAWATLGPTASQHGITMQGYADGLAMAPDGFGVIWESRGPLLVTRDGGSRWLALPRVGVPDVDFGIAGSAVGGGTAWVILARGDVHRRLLVTHDRGRTWRVVRRWN